MTKASERAFVRMEQVGHCYDPTAGNMAVQQIDLGNSSPRIRRGGGGTPPAVVNRLCCVWLPVC